MVDTTKAILNGAIGVGVWWINLPMILQMAVSIATLIYLIIKIIKETKEYKMPSGKGTYGTNVGRPAKKKKKKPTSKPKRKQGRK